MSYLARATKEEYETVLKQMRNGYRVDCYKNGFRIWTVYFRTRFEAQSFLVHSLENPENIWKKKGWRVVD